MSQQIPCCSMPALGLVGEAEQVQHHPLLAHFRTHHRSIERPGGGDARMSYDRTLKEENGLNGCLNGENLYDHGLGNGFLAIRLEEQATKQTKYKKDFVKMKDLCVKGNH